MSYNSNEVLQLLFTRPREPIFMPRGEEKRVMFDVPENYLIPKYQKIRNKLLQKWDRKGTIKIPVNNVNIPDLTRVMQLPRDANFSFLVDEHLDIANELIKIFMNQTTPEDLISIATYCHDRVNPYLFNYALSVALLHRTDTKDVKVPNYFQVFPSNFFNTIFLLEAIQANRLLPKEVTEPIIIPLNYTARDTEPEQLVAYFREDIGLSIHHYHWHLIYFRKSDGLVLIPKDRRGEIFYYMHQQIIDMYNAERFYNKLPRVTKYSNLREKIQEAYFPKLHNLVSGIKWCPRFTKTACSDINRPDLKVFETISLYESWENKIKEAVNNGIAKDNNGKSVSLTGEDGINILSNLLESNTYSINSEFYGHYHNGGHAAICLCHDPQGNYNEGSSLMGNVGMSIRDPIFYRWHMHITDIFYSLKDKLPPYSRDNLTFKDVTVTELNVSSEGRGANQLHTFWQQSEVDFLNSLDFTKLTPVRVRFTHLQHLPFTYSIHVSNSSDKQLKGFLQKLQN